MAEVKDNVFMYMCKLVLTLSDMHILYRSFTYIKTDISK